MSCIRKIWWPNLKSRFSFKTCKSKKNDALSPKTNINEEYKEVFRTKSYTEILTKVQGQLRRTNPFYLHLSNTLLEPRQDDAIAIARASTALAPFLTRYFNVSLDACNVCELLLRGVHRCRSNHRYIQSVINLVKERNVCMDLQLFDRVHAELGCFLGLTNPMSIISPTQFKMVHKEHTLLLQDLISKREGITRRLKFIRFCKRLAGYGLVVTATVMAVVVAVLAGHAVVGFVGALGLVMTVGLCRESEMEKIGEKVDVTARGAYILRNDMETMERLVTRVYDEVEHRRLLAEMCVRNGMASSSSLSWSSSWWYDVVKDMEMRDDGFEEHMDELEKHIYLCFLTINRSRRLVISQITHHR